MKRKSSILRILILIGIIVIANLISNTLFFRFDFTADQRYTLSQATEDILEDLDDVVTVTAYFTDKNELPPQLQSTYQDFNDLLVEYESLSGGNVVFEFINPNESQETEAMAQQGGVGPILVNVRESDQIKQMRAYLGATLQMGNKTELIPLVQPGVAMEYELTTSIKKLSLDVKPKLALIQGHGEPSMAAIPQLAQQVSILYDLVAYTITDTTTIPAYFKALLLLSPIDTIPDTHLAQLDAYLRSNGNIFLAYGNLRGDLNQAYLSEAPDIGVKNWLAGKGISFGNQFVIDANSASISVRQQQGPFIMTSQIKFPYFPIISNFSDHPTSKGLESLLLPFTSNLFINQQADSAIQFTPLAFTSELSGLIPAPAYVDINKEWQESDFNQEPQNVAFAVSGAISGAQEAKMVVVANGNFCVNGEGQQQQQLNADNINFASNAIDWLSDDTGLINLRTKGITSRPLDPVEDSTKTILKWANVFIPILLILIYALIRKQQFFRKRQNWLQENY